MKRFILLLFISLFSISSFAQSDIKTETFKVEGNCGMCKKRIEESAYIKGVKRAEWNKESQILTVIYRSSRTTLEDIAQSIAKAGHSSEKAESLEKDYNRLPTCCQYKTQSCDH